MLVRILSAAVALPLFLAVIFFLPGAVLAAVYALLCALAAHELLYATGIVKKKLPVALSMLCAAGMPFWIYYGARGEILLAAAFAVCAALFFIRMRDAEFGFQKIAACLFAAFALPAFLSAIMLLRLEAGWQYVILLPFLAAWMSDTGAYFAGSFFGKHKLCPLLSPKKTVEGAVGGLAAAALGAVIYGLIVNLCFDHPASYLTLALIGLLGAAAGQFGDLMFSCVKRETGIKDYGHLMPGHGGVLDRFDSAVMTTPLVYLILRILPL